MFYIHISNVENGPLWSFREFVKNFAAAAKRDNLFFKKNGKISNRITEYHCWTKNQSLLHKNAPEDNYKLHRKVFREIRSNLKMFDSNQSLKLYLIFKIIINLLNYHYSLQFRSNYSRWRIISQKFPRCSIVLVSSSCLTQYLMTNYPTTSAISIEEAKQPPSSNALDRKHLAVLNTWSGHTVSEQPFRCFVLSQNLKLFTPAGGVLSWVGGQYLSNIT